MATKTKKTTEVETVEVPVAVDVPSDIKYQKHDWLALVDGILRTYFTLALKANVWYTWKEALKAVEKFKGGLF